MAAKGYTTLAKVNQYTGKSLIQADVADLILAAEKYIDKITGRNFVADSAASAKLFDGCGSDLILIDDCIEITKVEKGSNSWGDSFAEVEAFVQETNNTGYLKLPTNYEADGYPIKKLALRSSTWLAGHANQRITAKWGYSELVPADVSFAATVMVSGMYMYGVGGAMGGVKSEKIGEYSVSYADKDGWADFKKAQDILNSYVKFLI